jgi:F-type H+/Na+-transporting ATPase subunit alpha
VKVEDQIISIYAVTKGHVDTIPETDVRRFEKELLEFVHNKYPNIPADIARDKALKDEKPLAAALTEFKATFEATVKKA